MPCPMAVSLKKLENEEVMNYQKYVQDLVHYRFYQGDLEDEEYDLFVAA